MSTTVFGGPNGNMPKQTLNAVRNSSDMMRRRILRDAVPKQFVQPTIKGRGMAASHSRAWGGTDDYLARRNYTCGGPSPSLGVGWAAPSSSMLRRAQQNCDDSGVEGTNCNPKFVPDASSFGNYRALVSVMQTYNK